MGVTRAQLAACKTLASGLDAQAAQHDCTPVDAPQRRAAHHGGSREPIHNTAARPGAAVRTATDLTIN